MPNAPREDVVVQLDVIEHAAGVYYLWCQSPYGETHLQLRLPAEGTELLRRLQMVETSVLRSGALTVTRGSARGLEKPIRRLGEELCNEVLRDETRLLFEESLRQAKRDNLPFRLLLRIRGSTLSQLPWEFLYDQRRGDYLALNVPVVRYLEVTQPLAPITVTLPLRILGVISRPEDREQLDVAAEREALSAAVAPLGAEQVQLRWLPGQRWEDLWRAARAEPWHIVHFIGHGGFDEDRGEGFLEFVDDRGEGRHVYATDLGRLLADNGALRLAVLNACESARAAGSDSFSSPAASLIRRGFPAVVAMQYEISDPAALVFAQALYAGIASGQPLDRAVTDARHTVHMSLPGSLEWGTPVLYLRSTSTRIFDVASALPQQQQGPSPPGPSQGTDVPTTWPPDSQQATPLLGGQSSAESVLRAKKLVQNWMKPQPHPVPARAPVEPMPPASPAPVTHAPTAQAFGLVETHRFSHPAPVRAVQFDPTGGRVCAGGDDGAALCWDLDRATVSRICRLPGLLAGIRALSLTTDGRYLAVAYTDPVVRVWDLDTEVVAVAIQPPERRSAWAVRFSPDDRFLAIACTDRVATITDDVEQRSRAWRTSRSSTTAPTRSCRATCTPPRSARTAGQSRPRQATAW